MLIESCRSFLCRGLQARTRAEWRRYAGECAADPFKGPPRIDTPAAFEGIMRTLASGESLAKLGAAQETRAAAHAAAQAEEGEAAADSLAKEGGGAVSDAGKSAEEPRTEAERLRLWEAKKAAFVQRKAAERAGNLASEAAARWRAMNVRKQEIREFWEEDAREHGRRQAEKKRGRNYDPDYDALFAPEWREHRAMAKENAKGDARVRQQSRWRLKARADQRLRRRAAAAQRYATQYEGMYTAEEGVAAEQPLVQMAASPTGGGYSPGGGYSYSLSGLGEDGHLAFPRGGEGSLGAGALAQSLSDKIKHDADMRVAGAGGAPSLQLTPGGSKKQVRWTPNPPAAGVPGVPLGLDPAAAAAYGYIGGELSGGGASPLSVGSPQGGSKLSMSPRAAGGAADWMYVNPGGQAVQKMLPASLLYVPGTQAPGADVETLMAAAEQSKVLNKFDASNPDPLVKLAGEEAVKAAQHEVQQYYSHTVKQNPRLGIAATGAPISPRDGSRGPHGGGGNSGVGGGSAQQDHPRSATQRDQPGATESTATMAARLQHKTMATHDAHMASHLEQKKREQAIRQGEEQRQQLEQTHREEALAAAKAREDAALASVDALGNGPASPKSTPITTPIGASGDAASPAGDSRIWTGDGGENIMGQPVNFLAEHFCRSNTLHCTAFGPASHSCGMLCNFVAQALDAHRGRAFIMINDINGIEINIRQRKGVGNLNLTGTNDGIYFMLILPWVT